MENTVLNDLKAMYGESQSGESGLVYLSVDSIFPHQDNPRKELGDLTELAESIKAKGIMQNLTVVPFKSKVNPKFNGAGRYTVIIGHRRLAAAKLAGLSEVPCVIVDMSEREQLATMLLENMQRVDLTAYEQAKGFQLMIDFGDTVDGIAEKTGFSKKTVKHRLEMAKLNEKTLKEVSSRQVTMEDFDKLSKIKSLKKRNEVLAKIGTANFNSAVEIAIREELIAEKMPPFVEKAKALGAKEMKPEDRWSGKYERIADIDVKTADVEKPLVAKKYQGEALFYAIRDYYGSLEIYRKKPKDNKDKRPKAEIEREKAIEDAKKQLKAMHEAARVLRRQFIQGVAMNTKNRELVLLGAVRALECGVLAYTYNIPAKAVLELMGEKTSNDYRENHESFRKVMQDKPSKAVPALVYVYMENDQNAKYYREVYGEFPVYAENVWLDNLYGWLISLGYEMSDEERALRDGSHSIFKRGVK